MLRQEFDAGPAQIEALCGLSKSNTAAQVGCEGFAAGVYF
jgi:hypothetical protein